MKANFDIKSWIWPALLAMAALYGFVLRGSDVPNLSMSLYALVAIIGAVQWAWNTKEAPPLATRPELAPVFMALMLLIAALSVLPIFQMMGKTGRLYDPSESLIQYIQLLGVMAAFVAGYRLSLNDETAKRLFDALLIMGGIWATTSIIMFIADPGGVYGEKKILAGRLTGAFSSANSAGTLFGCLSVVTLGRLVSRALSVKGRSIFDRLDPVMLAVCVISIAAMSMSLSRGAITATLGCMAIISAVLLWRRLPLAWLISFPIGAIFIILFLFASPLTAVLARFAKVDLDAEVRATIFKIHYDLALHQPWFGSGLGSFNTVNNTLVSAENYKELSIIRAAHNVYLQWFEETGVAGLSALTMLNLAVIIPMFQAARRRERMGGRIWAILFGYLVFLLHGLTDYAFQEPALTVFIAMLMGCGFAMAGNSARFRH